MCSFGLVGERG